MQSVGIPLVFTFIIFIAVQIKANSTAFFETVTNSDQCQCTFAPEHCDCSCTNPPEGSDLAPLPCNVTSCPNFSFELDGGSFDHLPPHFFTVLSKVNTFFFDAVNVNFTDYLPHSRDMSPFRGVSFKTEAYLVFLRVQVKGKWNWGSLGDLRPGPGAKASVQMIMCYVPVLTVDFSEICGGSVTSVRISKSSLRKLESGVFSGLVNLTEVNLAKNSITEVKRDHFPVPAIKLERLVLTKNFISRISDDLFSNMPNLQSVDLTDNPITTLSERYFKPYFNQVTFLGIQGFPLTCDCQVKWLKNETFITGLNNMVEAKCENPPNLNSKLFSELSAADLQC